MCAASSPPSPYDLGITVVARIIDFKIFEYMLMEVRKFMESERVDAQQQ